MRLSLTSLVRTLSYQRALTGEDEPESSQRKLALPAAQSTHPKILGGAVDFDRSGYYEGFGPNLTSVRLSGLEQHTAIKRELSARLGVTPSPHIADPSNFNLDVPAALTVATEELHAEGLINRVIEFEGQPNECLHAAVNPDFLSLINQ